MDSTAIGVTVFFLIASLVILRMLIRCLTQGKSCVNRNRIDDRTVLITAADTVIGIELTKELSRRGARVIMAVENVELATDVAVEIRGETNMEVVVEYCSMDSLKSIRDFCTKILEQESRIHVLVNLACVMWAPLGRTAEGFEKHLGINHLASFAMTQLLMPLLHRGAPDARIVTVGSNWYRRGSINWDDINFDERPYSACDAFNQSKLANLLFTKELARRLDATGVNTYCVNLGPSPNGLGCHVIRGLGCLKLCAASVLWLPWVQSAENSMQSILYCITETQLAEQTGLYYSDCAVQLTTDKASNMDHAHRLWEMTERMVALTS